MANALDIERAELIINYEFRDTAWLEQALSPTAYPTLPDGATVPTDVRKRLGKVGDGLIKLLCADEWLETRRDFGDLSKIETENFSHHALAEAAQHTGLASCFGVHAAQLGTTGNSIQVQATAVKAVIAAVWKDSGRSLRKTRAVVDALGLSRRVQRSP